MLHSATLAIDIEGQLVNDDSDDNSGSCSSLKTRLLLRNLISPAGYVPIDISGDYLAQVGATLQAEFPQIEVMPVIADFTNSFDIPSPNSS